MITTDLLYQALLVLGVLLFGAVTAVAGHAAWLAWTRRVDPPRLAAGRAALAATLAADAPGDAGMDPDIAALPARLRGRLLTDVARSLRGAQRRRLAELAADLGVVARARRWTASRLWWRRLHGIHLLSALGGADPIRHRLLDDPHPTVRAEAIAGVADHVDADLADRLVDLLADPSPLCRHAARDTLVRAGLVAVPVVAARLGRGDAPNLDALLDIAAGRPDHRYHAAARTLAGDERPSVRAGAVRLLGGLGGGDAIAVLEIRLADPEPAVREAAATALGRLGHWPVAPAVARLLRDPAWDVRRAAGEALAALGAPGALMLQRYSHSDDPYAADMARRVQETVRLRAVAAAESP